MVQPTQEQLNGLIQLYQSNKLEEAEAEAQKLLKYYYQFFVTRIGSAPYRGSGSSVKKGANNLGNDGMAYRVYGCGIKKEKDPMVVALESVVVLPK